MDLALLIARMVFGLGIAAHGARKLFGWFGGEGLSRTGRSMERMGFRPGIVFAGLAGLAECFSGLLVALGLLGPVGPALIVMMMITAMLATDLPNGFFTRREGIELPLVYSVAALLLAATGPGGWSVDARFGHWTPLPPWTAIGGAVVLALFNLGLRRVPQHAARRAGTT